MAGTWACWEGRGQRAEVLLWPANPPAVSVGRSHVMQRVLNTMQFLWVLGQATVDGLTRWLCAFTKHHRTMSDVLRAERYLLTQELLRVSATRAKTPLYIIKAMSLPAEHMWYRAGPISAA